jgi:hypothetical protein
MFAAGAYQQGAARTPTPVFMVLALATIENARLKGRQTNNTRKYLILLVLRGWLATLDDFRNWLIREAA